MSELLSLPRMARRVGVTQQWLRTQAEAGTVPCLQAGTRLLFNPIAVQEVLATLAARGQSALSSVGASFEDGET